MVKKVLIIDNEKDLAKHSKKLGEPLERISQREYIWGSSDTTTRRRTYQLALEKVKEYLLEKNYDIAVIVDCSYGIAEGSVFSEVKADVYSRGVKVKGT